jgi:beta-xylosidase
MKGNNIYLIFWFITAAFSQFSLAQISNIRVHDPVMIKESNVFHIFCTGQGISHYTSTDMVHWEKAAQVFDQKPVWVDQVVTDFKNHIWAPDIVFHNGVYFLYYSVSAFGKNTSAIGVTTNVTLDPLSPYYQWQDKGIVVQSLPYRDLWNAIDPNISFDEKGQAWMAFGSFWEGMKMVKLDSNLKSIAHSQEWHTIARRNRTATLDDADPGDAYIEAPFIFKKNGFYYLFVSWDLCCRGKESTYKVVVGRSKDIQGPYLDREGKSMYQGGGSLVLQGDQNWFGAGHCSVYSVDNQDYMFYHAYDAKDEGKPKLRISTIEWDENLWPLEITKY